MPEEINRMVTDCISDQLLTSCKDGDKNLIREGVDRKKIHFVGNVMIDSLLVALPYKTGLFAAALAGLGAGAFVQSRGKR